MSAVSSFRSDDLDLFHTRSRVFTPSALSRPCSSSVLIFFMKQVIWFALELNFRPWNVKVLVLCFADGRTCLYDCFRLPLFCASRRPAKIVRTRLLLFLVCVVTVSAPFAFYVNNCALVNRAFMIYLRKVIIILWAVSRDLFSIFVLFETDPRGD